MSGDTHAVSGSFAALVIIQPKTISEISMCCMFGAVGGLLLDIDLRQSKGTKLTKTIISIFLTSIITMLTLEHLGLDVSINFDVTNVTIVGYIGLLILVTYGMRTSHRMFTHSIEFVALSVLFFKMIGIPYMFAIAIGEISHIILDLFNKKKLKLSLLCNFKLCFNLVPANGVCNRLIFSLSSMFILLYIALVWKR